MSKESTHSNGVRLLTSTAAGGGRPAPLHGRRLFSLLLGSLLNFAQPLVGAEIVWTNVAGGNWNSAVNWDPNQVPGAADNAYITNAGTYTVTVNSAVTVNSITGGAEAGTQTLSLTGNTLTINDSSELGTNCNFSISGGTLTGGGDVTVNGVLSWAGGTMSGSGKTIVAGGATASLSGATKTLGRMLQNDGTVNWSAGAISGQGGAVLTNSGVFNATGTTTFSSAGSFGNGGTFNKSGTGTMFFNGIPFSNTGTVVVQGGTLRLGGGGTQSGSMEVDDEATLEFSNSYTYTGGSTLSGAGTVAINGGTHTFPAGTFTPTGTVNFNNGTITINNSFTPSVMGTVAGSSRSTKW